MVQLKDLKFLASQKQKDAETLLRNGRNAGAIYMMGYALELSLKRKISQTLNFQQGFPETSAEFASYSSQLAIFNGLVTGVQLTQVKQIRNHKLPDLLIFSGAQAAITSHLHGEWQIVHTWTPEKRYVRQRVTSLKAQCFVMAAKQIISEIS